MSFYLGPMTEDQLLQRQDGPPLRLVAVDPHGGGPLRPCVDLTGADYSPELQYKEMRYQGEKLAHYRNQGHRLCLSTGESDRGGAELFAWDVVIFLFPDMDPCWYVIRWLRGGFYVFNYHTGEEYGSLRQLVESDSYHRLGSALEPESVLKARVAGIAQAVSEGRI